VIYSETNTEIFEGIRVTQRRCDVTHKGDYWVVWPNGIIVQARKVGNRILEPDEPDAITGASEKWDSRRNRVSKSEKGRCGTMVKRLVVVLVIAVAVLVCLTRVYAFPFRYWPGGYGANMQHGMDWGPYLLPIGMGPFEGLSGPSYVIPWSEWLE